VGIDVAKRFNIEYRAADATASPYLQLGAMVRAGLEGIRRKLPPPRISSGDPGDLTPQERAAHGIGELPASLGEALDALEADRIAMGWLGPSLSRAYLMHKRGEIAMTEGQEVDELCSTYARAY